MSKIKLSIKNRFTGNIIFEYESENNTMRQTVEAYIKKELETKYRANLTDADLTDADLTDADLTDANLTDADLTDADLTDANLTRANLTDANLTRANLTDADLTRANLLRFKNDLWRVLLQNRTEIAGLKKSLIDGKIDGTKYEGDCACLKGTIRNLKQCDWETSKLIKAVSEPSEQWFLQIQEGQTPENNNVVKMTVGWIEEFETLIATTK